MCRRPVTAPCDAGALQQRAAAWSRPSRAAPKPMVRQPHASCYSTVAGSHTSASTPPCRPSAASAAFFRIGERADRQTTHAVSGSRSAYVACHARSLSLARRLRITRAASLWRRPHKLDRRFGTPSRTLPSSQMRLGCCISAAMRSIGCPTGDGFASSSSKKMRES